MNLQPSFSLELLQIDATTIPLIFLYSLIVLMIFGIYAWLKVNLERDYPTIESTYSEDEVSPDEVVGVPREKALDYSMSLATIYGIFSAGFIIGIIFVSIFFPETSFLIPFSITCAIFGIIIIFLTRSLLFRK